MDAAAAPKRQRLDEGAGAGELDLSALEASGGADALEVLDLRAAKRLLLGFERRLRDNLEARMKHPDDPARFADSEIALHSETDRLRLLAGAPDLFPDLVPLGLASSLSSLLTHDNADLAAAAASLLADLTDSDDPSDLAGVQSLADALVDANALDLLVHNLSRFSEADPDEAEAVHHTLAVLENLLDLRPHLADLVCDRTKLLRWLLARLKAREFDANKQYASEILAILLQNSLLAPVFLRTSLSPVLPSSPSHRIPPDPGVQIPKSPPLPLPEAALSLLLERPREGHALFGECGARLQRRPVETGSR